MIFFISKSGQILDQDMISPYFFPKVTEFRTKNVFKIYVKLNTLLDKNVNFFNCCSKCSRNGTETHLTSKIFQDWLNFSTNEIQKCVQSWTAYVKKICPKLIKKFNFV